MTRQGENPAGMVEVPSAVLAALRDAARTAWPAECCALLVGTVEMMAGAPGGRLWRVLRAVPTANAATRADRFEVPPADLFAVLRAADAEGLALIGHHHSHPGGPARPSATDAANAFYPDHAWLITATTPAGTPTDSTAWLPGEVPGGFLPLVLKILHDG